jgi:hypothetical protein
MQTDFESRLKELTNAALVWDKSTAIRCVVGAILLVGNGCINLAIEIVELREQIKTLQKEKKVK